MLEVNEIFGPTIQGEGKRVGSPSVFIRFGKCNFRCEGFAVEYETPSGVKKCSCDSYYAVDPAFKDQWHTFSSAKELILKVNTFLPSYKCDIVITGGEPLLYWKNEEFQKVLKYYIENEYTVTLETNASLNMQITQEYQKKILFSMSVKLSNSLEPLKKRVNIKTLTQIINNCEDKYLKFVINKDFLVKAKEEIDEILKQIPKVEVYLMPMGDTALQMNENSEAVINLALESGFKYCDRLHIRVWDNKRGV
ncbi:radical SAM protein [Malaciobacter mytili LMG 24559]|uniref:7-carboxy-7-deazaguanine synthase n=1 Tax=Malaciobacter mytili LMG 24559 TaxID=1032238 RepID=A0AAX2AF45_9BACT|nr:7-carboxy-7-deazaguanine synthase QueE [Malaciobacter mytili]AXH13974.1 7-carboxy-7-deazaguanine synthase [Malaciobacter mytili LMG 24559]RXK15260.1 radical SAM protein [Malaciobacter mytili LMG 24559]